MNIETFLLFYFILIILMVLCEIWILSNDSGKYLSISYRGLKSICEDFLKEEVVFNSKNFANELNRFYDEYLQEMPRLKKHYPNVVIWLDAIIFRIDFGKKGASLLKQYTYPLKAARDDLEKEHPFNKCEKYQQGILCDMEKIKTSENAILVQNIINRTEDEFLRLSGDIKKNSLLNIISIAIGIIGIIVSILMATMKF